VLRNKKEKKTKEKKKIWKLKEIGYGAASACG
jgi:hypothetical protein